MSESKLLWIESAREDDVPRIAHRIAETLRPSEEFRLWLIGPMGAGKTTITRAVLYALGLPLKVPVLSPTYTYMTEYSVIASAPEGNPKPVWYAHLDLYRMPDVGAMGDVGLEVIGFDDRKKYMGVFVEWPPTGGNLPTGFLRPTHTLTIALVGDGREYQLQND